jgi:3-oxoacyl-[acyl-carrier protein] reductase
MNTTRELEGKVALVTGAAQNIGRAIAFDLAAGGASVAINTRQSHENAARVAGQIRESGGQAEVYMADVADAGAVGKMVDGVLARFGRIDILVLNASVRREVAFTEMTFEAWREIMSITLDGSFHCIKACLPTMIRNKGGNIITLGGDGALSGLVGKVHGSAAKNGLAGMTRSLALEMAQHGIRVNCVSPGSIDTSRAAHRPPRKGAEGRIPLGRHGQSEEIAATVRFLCGPGATFITGQTIHVNGGEKMFF